LFLALIAGAPLAAQWIPVPALNAPPARSGFTLTPLPSGDLLLFGGELANPTATEWSWNGIGWSPVTTPVPRRSFHAMAVDETTGRLVLFGGIGLSGPLTDTWTFDGSVWTQVMTPHSPPSLTQSSMAFNPSENNMVLAGFSAGVFQAWRLDQGDWTQITTLIPPGAIAVYHDNVRRELGLFAVALGFRTYRFDNGIWQQTGAAGPLQGGTPLSTFDSDRGRLILFVPGLTNGTYEWDGLSASLHASTTPPSSFFPVIAYHPARSETIHVATTGPLSVWRWAPEPVAMATPFGTPCQSPQFQLGLAPGDSPQPGASHRLLVQGQNGSFMTFTLLGFSHTTFSGLPLPAPIPIGSLGCLLRVEPAIVNFVGIGLPAQLQLTLPNETSLLGQRYDAQALQFDPTGVLDTTNGLEVQIGLPPAVNALVETFATALNRDPLASGDVWASGSVSPVALGGDGRHGSFDHTHGMLNPSGEFEFDNDNFVVPAERSLTGQSYVITDGKYYFTDFVVPDGVKVRFTGSVPAQIFARGQADIRGTIDVSGAEMPFWIPQAPIPAAGQHVSNFDSRGPSIFQNGQPGGAPGCGGGRGGDGANECHSTGPDIVVGFPPPYDGKVGQDVRVSVGHAYGSSALGTPRRCAAARCGSHDQRAARRDALSCPLLAGWVGWWLLGARWRVDRHAVDGGHLQRAGEPRYGVPADALPAGGAAAWLQVPGPLPRRRFGWRWRRKCFLRYGWVVAGRDRAAQRVSGWPRWYGRWRRRGGARGRNPLGPQHGHPAQHGRRGSAHHGGQPR
jgi:hypothetical protein